MADTESEIDLPSEVYLRELKEKSPKELLAYAEMLEVENASSLRTQDMLFAILKELAEQEVSCVGVRFPATSPDLSDSGDFFVQFRGVGTKASAASAVHRKTVSDLEKTGVHLVADTSGNRPGSDIFRPAVQLRMLFGDILANGQGIPNGLIPGDQYRHQTAR